jgi:hypothetical protein
VDDDGAAEQMITAMSSVFDLMDAATIAAWDGLTGLQIQLLRVVATGMRVDRQSLGVWTRTSRGALVPSLAALLQRQVLEEQVDREGPHLVVAPTGEALLARVHRARTRWLRDAAAAAEPAVDEGELRRAVELLRRVADGA